MDKKHTITTQVIEDVVNNSSSDRILVHDLVDGMKASGFGLVMMIFAFGVTIPLPPPFPNIIAIPLLIFSIQMTLAYDSPKLPKSFSNLSVKRSVVATLVQKSSPYIRKIERFLRPRLAFVTSKIGERIIGVLTALFAIVAVIPFPFSNFIPGIGILVTAFGLLGKDGLVVIIGIMIGLIGVIISLLAMFLGVEFFNYIRDLLF